MDLLSWRSVEIDSLCGFILSPGGRCMVLLSVDVFNVNRGHFQLICYMSKKTCSTLGAPCWRFIPPTLTYSRSVCHIQLSSFHSSGCQRGLRSFQEEDQNSTAGLKQLQEVPLSADITDVFYELCVNRPMGLRCKHTHGAAGSSSPPLFKGT